MVDHLKETLDSSKWARKIRQLRKEKGWSQSDLAEQLGVGPQAISKTERGKSQFTLERLNRILDALGYEAVIELEEAETKTRADWGPIHATDPTVRSRIKIGRRLAEDLAEMLYSEFDVNAVYCFGSLVEDQGTNFHETSDVDVLVEGLKASKLFEAQSKFELDVIEQKADYDGFSFDVIRNESFQKDTTKLVQEHDAVLIAEES